VVALGTCYEGIYGCFSYDSGSSFGKPKLEVNNLILILTQLFTEKTDISTVKKGFLLTKEKSLCGSLACITQLYGCLKFLWID